MWQQISSVLYAGSLLASSAAAPPAVPAPGAAPAITIHRQVEEVRLSFSVDDNRRGFKNLPAGAFTIYDNEQEVSPTDFSADSELPLRIGLLVDRSDSVRKEFAAERRAAEEFLHSVLRPGEDSIFLLDFTHQLEIRRPSAGDLNTLSAASALAPGGQTALYDALRAAAKYDVMIAEETRLVRRVIILLSDGEDNDSIHSLDDAIAAAQMNDVSIYAITVHSSAYRPGDGVLAALADATGGRAFVLPNLKNLDRVFSEIQSELRSQYLVSFRPAGGEQCGFHALTVRTHNPNLHVRVRRGYLACRL